MRDVIYYVDVPAYNSIKLELQSSSKLIMEGRLQGDSSSNKGTCPGASTQFCGNVNGGKATSAWYNGNSATTRMYIMIEEPSASTKIKSFTNYANEKGELQEFFSQKIIVCIIGHPCDATPRSSSGLGRRDVGGHGTIGAPQG